MNFIYMFFFACCAGWEEGRVLKGEDVVLGGKGGGCCAGWCVGRR